MKKEPSDIVKKLILAFDSLIIDIQYFPWVQVIVTICALPFFAYLVAMVVMKGTHIWADPFSGPPWYHTLGWVALGGIAVGFVLAKLNEWWESRP